MTRHRKMMLMLAGLAALAVTLLVVWCPQPICRILNIQTYAVDTLDDYRQLVADEAAFYSLHRIRAVWIDCTALRDEVVTALKSGRLTLGTEKPDSHPSETARGTIEAWHQGRLLHLANRTLATDDEQQTWATNVRAAVSVQQRQDLDFLSRLFGGLVLHVSRKLIPIVLFSDHPCV